MKNLPFCIEKFSYIVSEEQIDVSFISPLVRRKLSLLDKAALTTMFKVFELQDVEEIVFSSECGEFTRLDNLIKQYQELSNDRKKSQEGVINYDKKSLEMLRKQQVARYKALAQEIRAKKLQNDPNVLFNEIAETNKQVIELYKKVMSSTDNLDKYFDLGRLMDYVSRAYESFYRSMKSERQSERAKERYKAKAAERGEEFNDEEYDKLDFNKSSAKEEINDAKKYIDNVKTMIKEIEDQL